MESAAATTALAWTAPEFSSGRRCSISVASVLGARRESNLDRLLTVQECVRVLQRTIAAASVQEEARELSQTRRKTASESAAEMAPYSVDSASTSPT